jgi:hypothetical protein
MGFPDAYVCGASGMLWLFFSNFCFPLELFLILPLIWDRFCNELFVQYIK